MKKIPRIKKFCILFLDIMKKKVVSICRLKHRKPLKNHFFLPFFLSPPPLNFQDTWVQMISSVPIFSINTKEKVFNKKNLLVPFFNEQNGFESVDLRLKIALNLSFFIVSLVFFALSRTWCVKMFFFNQR